MRKYLFIILTLICCHAFGQNPVFYKTTKKHNLYLIEMSGEIAKIYKMGIYHFKWPDTIIIKLDTLKRNIENKFKGNTYEINKKNEDLILKIEHSKTLITEIIEDKAAFLTLNKAYYLKSYFDMSDSVYNKFPLTKDLYRNRYNAWNNLANKSYNHNGFKQKIDREIQTISDSIFNIQTRLIQTTDFITSFVKKVNYSVLRDSVKELIINNRPQSGYFDKSVYQMAKTNPEYFHKLLQDFPKSKELIYFSVEQDKELIKQLKQVQGYEDLKKEFLKHYRFGKSMPYRGVGMYALFIGLITWGVVSQI